MGEDTEAVCLCILAGYCNVHTNEKKKYLYVVYPLGDLRCSWYRSNEKLVVSVVLEASRTENLDLQEDREDTATLKGYQGLPTVLLESTNQASVS